MFCPNCGKTIDDNAPFCGFCGAPTGVAASAPAPEPAPAQPVIPQNPVPQNTVPQYTAPQAPQASQQAQYTAPQQQYAAPQQQTVGGAGFSLDAKTIDIINKCIRAALILLSILIIIGAIGSMAVAGAISSAFKMLDTSGLGAVTDAKAFYGLARVPAIIAFVISIGGLAFTILTKQRSLFSYICAGVGVLLFIFNFVLYGGYVSLATSLYTSSFSSLFGGLSGVKIGGIIVAGIFLLLGALAMIAASLAIILNKEDIIKYKPKY
ncbi:MAG: zinc ribbon domain-containing protein [Oscillospiraceae bacterium]|nr:zinc ribbon domain-containing protein [Oscillospiraceae bacterium]